jgi:hypothetical protein
MLVASPLNATKPLEQSRLYQEAATFEKNFERHV